MKEGTAEELLQSTKPPASERVTAGWNYLDERLGKDCWQSAVDVPTLDIMSVMDCLLAQLSGEHYRDALEDLGLTQPQAEEYGFISWPNPTWRFSLEDDGCQDYRDLTGEWARRLTEWQGWQAAEDAKLARVESSACDR